MYGSLKNETISKNHENIGKSMKINENQGISRNFRYDGNIANKKNQKFFDRTIFSLDFNPRS